MNPQNFPAKTTDLLKIGVVANVFEWYEFCVYGYLASTIGKVFFAPQNDILAVIYAFFIFALSYFARPVGSLFFGYLGDRRGKGLSLRWSIMLMAMPTVFIGLLPSYQTIGVWAPIFLMLLRFIQGFAAGGELPGSACYVYEASPLKNRGIICSTVATSSLSGLLLGSAAATLLFLFFDRQVILDWAWRIPFLLGLPMTFIILSIRSVIVDNIKPKQETPSLWKNILQERGAFIQGLVLVAFLEVCIYLLFVWMPSYLEVFMKMPTKMVYLSNVLAIFTLAMSLLVFGYLSRFVAHKKIMFMSVLSITLLAYPLFLWLQTPSISTVFIVQILFAILLSGLNGVIMEMLGNLFSDHIRCTGMSLSFTCGAPILGGPAPVLLQYI